MAGAEVEPESCGGPQQSKSLWRGEREVGLRGGDGRRMGAPCAL
jgi:hypothetical protein